MRKDFLLLAFLTSCDPSPGTVNTVNCNQEKAIITPVGEGGGNSAGGDGASSAPTEFCFCDCPLGLSLPDQNRVDYCKDANNDERNCCLWVDQWHLTIGQCLSGVCSPTHKLPMTGGAGGNGGSGGAGGG